MYVMRRLFNIVYGMMKQRTAYVIPEMPKKRGSLTNVAASARDAAMCWHLFCYPRGATFASGANIDALDGTDALLVALRETVLQN
ncbi:hypothetical protein SPSIL_002680 [Sporomusa silvacetica DSM 10669]|uniref:Uncharacterized protein n=1 Tax=Sporomusa silvacetica DSM 10669 TaxID=1123289 RepID=A0ABZ3IFI6_9FIRM|nr:hypothetical protein SPSIL_29700 [Sporomusa silvacetica DSM 10669]